MRESLAIRLIMTCAGVVLLGQTSLASPIDPCALVSKADAAALLGSPVWTAPPSKPEKDEETGGTVVYCNMNVDDSLFRVSVVTFGSASEARAKTTKELLAERIKGRNLKIEQVNGLGDRAYWTTYDSGAQYVVVKGSRVLGLRVGGLLTRSHAGYESVLRPLVVKALAKL